MQPYKQPTPDQTHIHQRQQTYTSQQQIYVHPQQQQPHVHPQKQQQSHVHPQQQHPSTSGYHTIASMTQTSTTGPHTPSQDHHLKVPGPRHHQSAVSISSSYAMPQCTSSSFLSSTSTTTTTQSNRLVTPPVDIYDMLTLQKNEINDFDKRLEKEEKDLAAAHKKEIDSLEAELRRQEETITTALTQFKTTIRQSMLNMRGLVDSIKFEQENNKISRESVMQRYEPIAKRMLQIRYNFNLQHGPSTTSKTRVAAYITDDEQLDIMCPETPRSPLKSSHKRPHQSLKRSLPSVPVFETKRAKLMSPPPAQKAPPPKQKTPPPPPPTGVIKPIALVPSQQQQQSIEDAIEEEEDDAEKTDVEEEKEEDDGPSDPEDDDLDLTPYYVPLLDLNLEVVVGMHPNPLSRVCMNEVGKYMVRYLSAWIWARCFKPEDDKTKVLTMAQLNDAIEEHKDTPRITKFMKALCGPEATDMDANLKVLKNHVKDAYPWLKRLGQVCVYNAYEERLKLKKGETMVYPHEKEINSLDPWLYHVFSHHVQSATNPRDQAQARAYPVEKCLEKVAKLFGDPTPSDLKPVACLSPKTRSTKKTK